MNSVEATEAIHALWQEHKDLSWRERNAQIGPRKAAIMDAWKAYLFTEQGSDLPERTLNILYPYAWEQGHASGLNEVEMYFNELCGLQRKIQRLT